MPRILSERLHRLFGSDSERERIERMILHATGELTPTEEYVYRHGVWSRGAEGNPVDDEFARGEWDEARREEFLAEGSRPAVEAALSDLEERGLIRRVEDGDGEYWRLTEAGREERDRLLDRFREELDELQRRHGIVAAEITD